MDEDLRHGRRAFEQRVWGEAHRALARRERDCGLAAGDLERLAQAAYLIGRDDDYLDWMERAQQVHAEAGERRRAARCAFWLGFQLSLSGRSAQASGWLGRAQRLLEGEPEDCAERGYLLIPEAERQLDDGDGAAAHATAAAAVRIGEGCGEADLVAGARHQQGRALLQQGQLDEGLALLDETMVAVVGGELSPLMTGLIYCSVIDSCRQVYALGQAGEWTAALARWCDAQRELVAFTGTCLVHRAEILEWRGDWAAALAEAQLACARFEQGHDPHPPAAALYQQGEIHRLRGAFEAAEAAYRRASEWGRDPQPGLALLRLAQGRREAAAGAIRRALGATTGPLPRARLLSAQVEILLAVDDVETAAVACQELEATAQRYATAALGGLGAQARGAIELARGDAQAALNRLRDADKAWRQLEAPYPAARVRVQAARACRILGDEDGAALELAAARSAFQRLGATPELERIDALGKPARPHAAGTLTPRERQVLALVAGGHTNKAIARELGLSERTVDRHLSNVFNKLDVPSRAAATAHALRHGLI